MTTILSRENLTEEQLKALDKAAMLVIKARRQGADILRQSGIPDLPDDGPFGSPCQATLFTPTHHACRCRNYTGNIDENERCKTRFDDPGVGERACGHLPSDHLFT